MIQFDVISRCKSSNVFITLHQINGGKCIGKLKFNLKSFLIDKENSNIQETICLDLKTKLNNDLFFNGSKLVFDLNTNNLSFDLFPSKLQITKFPVENQVLNIHVKLHELFVKEAFYKQAFEFLNNLFQVKSNFLVLSIIFSTLFAVISSNTSQIILNVQCLPQTLLKNQTTLFFQNLLCTKKV